MRELDNAEVHKADPRARRNAVLIVVIAGLVGALLLHVVGSSSNRISDWMGRDPARAAWIVFALMTFCLSGPMLGLALWAGRFAARIRQAGRYPPPEAKLTRDTRVRTGSKATAVARLHYLLAVIAVGVAVCVPVLFWRALHGLLERVP